jgi:hypothetical protein
MIKTSIGELKLSPIKDNGKFMFFNDFITINGKVSKGDRIHIYVDGYEMGSTRCVLKNQLPPNYSMVVRGESFEATVNEKFATMEELYQYVSEQYKSQFYFGKKS